MNARRRILQIGYGAFGATHLRAWLALGQAECLILADKQPEALAAARQIAPDIRTVDDFRSALADCDAVDIVTQSDTHYAIASVVLAAGKPVLIEKPIVTSLDQARDLAALAVRHNALVRGGYYFRYHPKTVALRKLLDEGALGKLRVLTGRFAGIKRTRADAGALLNDAVHFLDLFVWLLGEPPTSLYAVTRDHFGRGLEDFASIVLQFRSGAVAQIESGTIQPGRWPDAVVPGAITSKEIAISGSLGVVEIDYAAETMSHRAVAHVQDGAIWQPRFAEAPPFIAAAADPVAVVTEELRDFLAAIDSGQNNHDALDGGVTMARLLEAALRSAADNVVVKLET
ncbi:MAG: Gfo/Idh/MocA family oxidoreductase [Rhodospirillales bacterium]